MFVNPENWMDADKYFNKCYITVKEYGNTLVLIKKVTEQALWGADQHGQNVCIEIDGISTKKQGYQLDYVLPKKAYFQVGTNACLLSRIPARMWKKGLSEENTRITALGKSFTTLGITFDLLKCFIAKQEYLPYTELENNASIALSPRIAMNKEGTIFVDLSPIGKYYKKSNTVTVTRLFEDNVKPLFKGATFARL